MNDWMNKCEKKSGFDKELSFFIQENVANMERKVMLQRSTPQLGRDGLCDTWLGLGSIECRVIYDGIMQKSIHIYQINYFYYGMDLMADNFGRRDDMV